MVPAAARAKELGIAFALEPTTTVRTDISFVFSLRDALDVAREAGMSVVLDLVVHSYERGLDGHAHRSTINTAYRRRKKYIWPAMSSAHSGTVAPIVG
jgi:hypothetical protein